MCELSYFGVGRGVGTPIMFFLSIFIRLVDSEWREVGMDWDTVVRYSVDLDTILRIYDF
jgi:hypothetical protein